MKKKILLQIKFLLVQFLNTSVNFVPVFLRRYYLACFGIKLGQGTCIHRGVRFFHIGNLTIGKKSTVNFSAYLDNRRPIHIGSNVGIAHHAKIYTLGHHIDDPFFSTKGKPVVIEDHVFIFANALIMPGVTIKKGAIVLPGSVVTKDVQAYTVVGGNPACFVKNRNPDLQYDQHYPYLFAL